MVNWTKNQNELSSFGQGEGEQDFSPAPSYRKLGAAALPVYEQQPAEIILSDSTVCPLSDEAEPKEFQRLFLQTFAMGAATDEAGTPHFFYPQTFLQNTGQRVFRSRVDYPQYGYGLSAIVETKNSPESRDDPAIQESALSAIREYLTPDLFAGNFTKRSELIEIYAKLSPEARKDPMLNQCLIEADVQRTQEAQRLHDETIARATEAPHPFEPTPHPDSFKIKPRGTTIEQLLDKLKNSSNREGYARVDAIKKWGDFIRTRIKDCHLEEDVISFGSDPYAKSRYARYSNEDTYAVIAFDYAGHRCMIAESCGRGCSDSVSAAMKIWRGDLADKQGWRQAFTQTKSSAASQDLCQNLRHADFASSGQPGSSDIDEAEDLMFRSAFHYFETGKLVGTGKQAAEKLSKLIGPQMWRPNAAN